MLDLHELWERVNATPGASWKLADLALALGVSVRQFRRLMRENYDLTSEQMLKRIRMEHARELLAATDLTMEMISERVGYHPIF
ncbi:MAG: transcriptional regulator GlxA family with amidase domain [Kiritimatiellia bacterium]|jgi:transcriptional regulator GlxA family with amidase domain